MMVQKHSDGVGSYCWLLTGDFNIDAIAEPAVEDEFGYVYDNQSNDSEEYLQLMEELNRLQTRYKVR